MGKNKSSKMARVMQTEPRCDTGTDPMTDVSSFDPFARVVSTTTTRRLDYQTVLSSNAITNQSMLSFGVNPPRTLASRTQRKDSVERNLDLIQSGTEGGMQTEDEVPGTLRTIQRQALAEAILAAMSKGLEPLLAPKRQE